jgi:hypothetical protein
MEITKEQIENVYYNEKLTLKQSARKLKIGYNKFRQYIKEYSIQVKPSRKQYFANDNAFSNWNEKMAYCLGFITGDGHIWKNRPFFTIGIHENDIKILEYIRDYVSPDSLVRNDPKNNKVQICVHSKQIWEDLQKYNANHDKTFNLKIDFDIPEEFWGDYLRGFFDADGCIYYTQPKKSPYYTASFSCASKPMLEYIKNRLGIGRLRCFREKYYELSFSQSNCLKLYDVMYKNENCFKLERKYEKFLKIHTDYKFWTKEEDSIILEHIKDRNTRQLFTLLNRAPKAIQSRKNKLRKNAKIKN